MAKSVKLIRTKGPREAQSLVFDQKICPGVRIRQFLKIFPGDGNA